MDLDQDFQDLLAAFERASARYLLIGGYAVAVHARPRYTKDIDLWIDPDPDNVVRVAQALAEFGAPPKAVADLQSSGLDEIVWFGMPPARVDLLKRIPGVEFPPAYENRLTIQLGSVKLDVIARADLISAKRAAGRPQDLLDLKALEDPGDSDP